MTPTSVRTEATPEMQRAWLDWQWSRLAAVDHVTACRDGCTDLMMCCVSGQEMAERERALWRVFDAERQGGLS